MHIRTTTAVLLAAAGLALTACSAGAVGGDRAAAASAGTTTAANTPGPTPTTFTLGRAWHWSNSTGAAGTTTVLAYTQPVLRSDPPGTSLGVAAGSQWGRLDIRVCQTAGPSIGVSQDPWHLQFPDGSQADVTGLGGGDFPKPEFPQDGTITPGQCARGGIMFPIPKGQHPVTVAYSPESAPEPVYWTIPAR